MGTCRRCGEEVESAFRFCPWCGHVQRLKVTEFFFAHRGIEDPGIRALRVSRYLGEEPHERHVRFSIWSDAGAGRTRVEAAISLDEEEAERAARFLAGAEHTAHPRSH